MSLFVVKHRYYAHNGSKIVNVYFLSQVENKLTGFKLLKCLTYIFCELFAEKLTEIKYDCSKH